jgi:predicted ATP-dependent Lon-type protease
MAMTVPNFGLWWMKKITITASSGSGHQSGAGEGASSISAVSCKKAMEKAEQDTLDFCTLRSCYEQEYLRHVLNMYSLTTLTVMR